MMVTAIDSKVDGMQQVIRRSGDSGAMISVGWDGGLVGENSYKIGGCGDGGSSISF